MTTPSLPRPSTEDRSPQYSITFGPGVADRLRECVVYAEAWGLDLERNVETREQLDDIRRKREELRWSLLRCLFQVLMSNTHDGGVRLHLDFAPKSFLFTYDSGYHGGLIFHDSSNSWSVHT